MCRIGRALSSFLSTQSASRTYLSREKRKQKFQRRSSNDHNGPPTFEKKMESDRKRRRVEVDDGKRWQFWGKSYTKEERAEFEHDETAMYSVTDARTADRISKLVQDLGCDDIVDGCACVGGNTLSFGRHFKKVTAIELDKTRFAMLEHNCGLQCLRSTVCVGPSKLTKFFYDF